MKLKEHKWVVVKIVLIVASTLAVDIPATTGEEIPIGIVTAVPFIFFILFLPWYIRTCQRKLIVSTKELWNAYPFSLFNEPMAFYHLAAWVAVCNSIALFIRSATQPEAYDVSAAWFLLSASAGCFIAIWRVKNSQRNPSNAGEHRGAVDAAARPD